MSGQCRQANVIYGATVKTLDILGETVEESAETYTGISYPVWKIRMYRHHTTFNNPVYRSETALADYKCNQITLPVCLKASRGLNK